MSGSMRPAMAGVLDLLEVEGSVAGLGPVSRGGHRRRNSSSRQLSPLMRPPRSFILLLEVARGFSRKLTPRNTIILRPQEQTELAFLELERPALSLGMHEVDVKRRVVPIGPFLLHHYALKCTIRILQLEVRYRCHYQGRWLRNLDPCLTPLHALLAERQRGCHSGKHWMASERMPVAVAIQNSAVQSQLRNLVIQAQVRSVGQWSIARGAFHFIVD